MALDALKAADTINALEIFLDRRRPPEEMRDNLDLAYRIEGQSIFIYTIREHWMIEGEKIESSIAKTTWVHSQQVWKIYWLRGNLKWYPYDPPTVKTIQEFLNIVHQDPHGCFWG